MWRAFSFVFIRFLPFHTAFLQGKKAIRLRRMAFVLFFFSPYNNKAKLFNLPEMLFSAGSGIDSGRIDAAVPQQTGQVFQILLALVETAGKQMPQITRKDLSGGNLCFPAQGLHHRPDITAVQRLS